jgi:hypothetical protein
MLRHATGVQSYPLKAGNTDAPVPAAGNNTTFQLDSIPILVGKLAYYLPFLVVTLKFTLTQSGGTGVAIESDVLKRMLFESIELRNAWHGTPVKASYFLGAYLPIIEYVGCGFRYAARQAVAIQAANGAYAREVTFAIPLAVGTNVKPMQTAQLALFYRECELVFNMAPAATLTAFSPGASIAFTSLKASAVLYPHKELWLAPGSEWVFYESTASAGQTQVVLNSFGNQTGLNGVDPNAGILALLACSSGAGMGGAFLPSTITQFNFPWRGQIQTNHPESLFVAPVMMSMGEQRGQQTGTAAAVGVSDFAGFPYVAGNVSSPNSLTADLENMYGAWLVLAQSESELSKVQLAYGNPAYFMTATFGGANNRTLSWQLKSWTESKIKDAIHQINGSGLARAVRGGDISVDEERGYGGSMRVQPGDERFLPRYFR